jgi:hypothetical protein
MTLATSSSWFHKYFQSRENMKVCDVTFFNISDKIVQSAIDVIYGKEIIFPEKDKQKLTWFLTKLGVKWSDEMEQSPTKQLQNTLVETPTSLELSIPPTPKVKVVTSANSSKGSMLPPTKSKSLEKTPEPKQQVLERKETTCEEDFFSVLDKFTETSEEELAKIGHMLIGESGTQDRRYKCLKCPGTSKFFTQAERHNLEHEHEAFSSVRNTLRKAELERANDAKNIAKIEKGIGKTEGKTLLRALRSVNFFCIFLILLYFLQSINKKRSYT